MRRCAVLSVAKLALGQEAYYEQQVASGMEDYYAGRGESPGIWTGVGARGLGLAGVVGDGDLGTILGGVNPADGARLRAPVRPRTVTTPEMDPATGEWRDAPKTLAPVAGFDLVFSCPKSVSVLHALTGDERVRRVISDAHERAWQAAVAYLETEACVTRRGRGGTTRQAGGGFVAAAFRHRTSRAQDPHLYTHVLIANLTATDDGYRALDGQAILRTHRLAAGYLYEAHLRHELCRSLGVTWTEPVKGMAEIQGMPSEVLEAFSTRRRTLVEHMREHGTQGFHAARVAALTTRQAKEHLDLPALRETWIDRAANLGLGAPQLRDLLDHHRAHPAHAPTLDVEALTAHQAVVTTPQIICTIAGSLRDGAPADEVLRMVEETTHRPEIVRIGDPAAPGVPERFTTRDLLDLEHDALARAHNGQGAGAPAPTRDAIEQAKRDAPLILSVEQQRLVRLAGGSPDRVVCIVGAAGTGKTAALQALVDAHQHSGIPILGAAPSGRAADELAQSTGLHASTMHSLLHHHLRRHALPDGCVLIIDEAGMADTRTLSPIVRAVDEANGKVILVGDPAQLPAVGAGGLFAALAHDLDAIRLTEIHRQHNPQERRAITALRERDAETYLTHLARHDRLHLGDDYTHTKARLVRDWWADASRGDLADVMMIAERRSDVRDLNDAARQLMHNDGRLGPEHLIAADRDYRVGDRIICRRNHHGIGITNGTRGTIIAIDPIRSEARVSLDDGSHRILPDTYLADHVEHGYAITAHAAQGATVNRAHVLAPVHGDQAEWSYVAATRAREDTHLYTAAPPTEVFPVSDAIAVTSAALRAAMDRPSLRSPASIHARRHAAAVAPGERQSLMAERAWRHEQLQADREILQSLGWRARRRHADTITARIDSAQSRIAEIETVLGPAQPRQRQHPTNPRLPAVARPMELDATAPLPPTVPVEPFGGPEL